METRLLGRTGVHVSSLALGGFMFGPLGNDDPADCERIIGAALDAGITMIDTSDVYGAGASEQLIGTAIKRRGCRNDVVLATKCWAPMGRDPNRRGGSRRWITQAVDDSLRRLQTDWIDLYQLHRPDPHTDLDETLGTLSDLVRAGKVRMIGSSTFLPSALVEAQWVARERHHVRLVTEQPPYSLLHRAAESDVLPTCARHGIGVLTWGPLAGGWLTGRRRAGQPLPRSSRERHFAFSYDMTRPENQAKLAATEQFALLAQEAGITLIELALGFVLSHPAVTSAIIGPRTLEQLQSYLDVPVLNADVLDAIDRIVAPGVTINPDDAGLGNPALAVAARRRA